MKKILISALLLALALTAACQNNPKAAQDTRQNDQNATMQPTPAMTQQPAAQDGTATPAPSETPAATDKPPVATDHPTTAKLYHLNKNYFIVPNDPATSKKVVLLTFDDGPKDRKMIDPLINTLDKHKAKAIFFVNGYRIKAHPELLKLIYDRGQTIGNHSWDHIDLKKETNSKIDQQIDDVQKIIKDTIGIVPVFFRPPYGSSNPYLKQKVKDEGMLFMTWSNGSLDWQNLQKPGLVITNVLQQLQPGSDILMHELPWTVEALDTLLTKLEEKGYGFVDPASIDLVSK